MFLLLIIIISNFYKNQQCFSLDENPFVPARKTAKAKDSYGSSKRARSMAAELTIQGTHSAPKSEIFIAAH